MWPGAQLSSLPERHAQAFAAVQTLNLKVGRAWAALLLARPHSPLDNPVTLRLARWDEIDLEAATWTVPHRVPLSSRALDVLAAARGTAAAHSMMTLRVILRLIVLAVRLGGAVAQITPVLVAPRPSKIRSHVRSDVILRHAPAVGVHVAEVALRAGVPGRRPGETIGPPQRTCLRGETPDRVRTTPRLRLARCLPVRAQSNYQPVSPQGRRDRACANVAAWAVAGLPGLSWRLRFQSCEFQPCGSDLHVERFHHLFKQVPTCVPPRVALLATGVDLAGLPGHGLGGRAPSDRCPARGAAPPF